MLDPDLDVVSCGDAPHLPSPLVGSRQGSGDVEGKEGGPQPPSTVAAWAAHDHCGEGKGTVSRNHSFSSEKRSGPPGSLPCMQVAQLAAGWEGITESLCPHMGREQRTTAGAWGTARPGLPGLGGPLSLAGSRRDSRWCLLSNRKYHSDVGSATHLIHRGPDAADPGHDVPMMQGRGPCPGICCPGAWTCHRLTGTRYPHPSPRPIPSGVPCCPCGAPRCPRGAQLHCTWTWPRSPSRRG